MKSEQRIERELAEQKHTLRLLKAAVTQTPNGIKSDLAYLSIPLVQNIIITLTWVLRDDMDSIQKILPLFFTAGLIFMILTTPGERIILEYL